jgi:hypothetical protein
MMGMGHGWRRPPRSLALVPRALVRAARSRPRPSRPGLLRGGDVHGCSSGARASPVGPPGRGALRGLRASHPERPSQKKRQAPGLTVALRSWEHGVLSTPVRSLARPARASGHTRCRLRDAAGTGGQGDRHTPRRIGPLQRLQPSSRRHWQGACHPGCDRSRGKQWGVGRAPRGSAEGPSGWWRWRTGGDRAPRS